MTARWKGRSPVLWLPPVKIAPALHVHRAPEDEPQQQRGARVKQQRPRLAPARMKYRPPHDAARFVHVFPQALAHVAPRQQQQRQPGERARDDERRRVQSDD